MIIPDLVSFHTRRRPDRVALVAGEARLTYAELDALVDRCSGGLAALGLAKGDRVAMLLGNDSAVECVVGYLGVHRAGAINVPLNVRLAPPEIESILAHAEARALIVHARQLPELADVVERLPALERLVVLGDPVPDGAVAFDSLLAGPGRPDVPVSVDDWADFIYTSGTTGLPKGTVHSHLTALHLALAAHPLDITGDDVYETAIPFYTSSGCHTFLLPALYAGATMVIDAAFEVEGALATIARERTTIYFGVPAMFIFMLASPHLGEGDRSSLRTIFYGGSIMPFETIKELERAFPGVRLYNLYGLTEGGPGGTMLEPQYALAKPGSVGKALPPFTEIRVADDAGADVAAGEVGEILIKTPSAMVGYYKAPEQTAETIRGGWIHTGDLGQLDDDGFLYVVDRKKDMIIRGGFNVYPGEVEAVLQQHPGILEVAVVGVPHPQLGEDVKAVVVARDGAELAPEAVVEFCRGKLADFKQPRHVEFRDALPRNAMGKVLKRVLRET